VTAWLNPLNDLAGGLFLLTAFAMVATRQVRGCLRFFVLQSFCLIASALLIGAMTGVKELFIVAGINLITKPIVIPWLLRRSVPREIYAHREIALALSVPTALLIALAIAVFSYFAGRMLIGGAEVTTLLSNVPIGIAGLLIGAYTIAVRREALPQLLGLLAMENGAFFLGVAFTPQLPLPLIAEIAAAFDTLIIVVPVGILTRSIHERAGTTEVGSLTKLKEERLP